MGNASKISLRKAALTCAGEFSISYQDGSTDKVYVRTRTQSEIQAADMATAEERLAIKEKYKTGSTFYNSLVASLEMESEDSLAAIILLSDMGEIAQKARRELPVLMPFDPGRYKTAGDLAKAEEAYEQRKADYDNQLDQAVRRLISEREAKLVQSPKSELVEKAIRPRIQMFIEQESQTLLQAWHIYDSVYLADDSSKHYFDNVEEVIDLAPQVKDVFLAAIEQVSIVRPIDIKNSQGKSVMLIGLAEPTPEVSILPSTNDSQGSDSPRKSGRGGRRQS